MNYNMKIISRINEAFFALKHRNFRRDFDIGVFELKRIFLILLCMKGNLFWIILLEENSWDL